MRILSVFFLLLCGFVSSAQEWVNLKEQGAPFEEIQAAFEAEWEGKTIEKGQGHSIYKRWEQFIEPRVYGESANWTELSSFLQKAWEEKKATIAKAKPGLAKTNGNWTALGPQDWINSSYAPGNGRINVVAVNPLNSNEYFVGTPAGGMWKTSDNGNSWEPMTDNLPSPGVSGIAIHPTNPDIMYIGTGDSDATDTYGLGVFKTTNGGADWETTGFIFDDDQESITKVLMHPNNPETIFAGSTDGLWKTTDGGTTWYNVLNGRIRDFEFNPSNPDIIYVGRERFYVSNDGGESFSQVSSGLPSSNDIGRIAIGVTPADASMVYLLIADDADGGFLGIWRSTNNGVDFEERATSPNILSGSEDGNGSGGQGFYDLAIAVSPINEDNVFCGGVNLWESNNGGNSFAINAHWIYNTPGTEYVHADIHQLEFFGDDLFSASDGGLWRSTNFGNSFTNKSFGLEITQCYRIGVQLQDPNRVVLGSQDNGSMLKANNWYHVQGGDGMQCFFHPTDASKMYVSSQYGSLYRSDNFGDDFDWAAIGIDDDGAWTTPWELDINNPSVMYAGYQNMWRSTNGGAGWAQVSSNINETLRYIDISPVNSNRVYAGTYDQIFTTSNGGNAWTELNTVPLPNIGISWIAASEFDASTLYVCLSGTSPERKVYRTVDNGENWENISDNLPNVPFNTIVEDPNLEGSLYVGSDLGVYHRHPDLANWQAFDSGLPMTIVNELEIHPTAGKIYAGTYGRGIWVSDLFELSEDAPIAEFSVDRFAGCSGSEFSFTDLSLDHYPEWTWTFEGATPATSNEQHPEVSFDTPGVFEVSLTVSNANGSSTETK
ncbi:MAG: VPS10 domain-containing protein, partial [Flavobacteriales bacterium]